MQETDGQKLTTRQIVQQIFLLFERPGSKKTMKRKPKSSFEKDSARVITMMVRVRVTIRVRARLGLALGLTLTLTLTLRGPW